MTEPRFQTLTRKELHEELRKLGRAMESSEIDALVGMDVLPVTSIDDEGYPLFAVIQLVDAIGIRGAGDLDALRRRAGVFRSAFRGAADGLSAAHRELRQQLADRSVLGELHRMLPVMEWAALETLRGDARLEWRIRQSLADLARIMAADPYRDEAMTPIYSKETAAPPSPALDDPSRKPSLSESHREPRLTTYTGSPVIEQLASTDDAPAPAPPPEPYAPGPDDRHPPGFRGGDGARMPVLRADADTGASTEPPVHSTAVFPAQGDDAPAPFEDTTTFAGPERLYAEPGRDSAATVEGPIDRGGARTEELSDELTRAPTTSRPAVHEARLGEDLPEPDDPSFGSAPSTVDLADSGPGSALESAALEALQRAVQLDESGERAAAESDEAGDAESGRAEPQDDGPEAAADDAAHEERSDETGGADEGRDEIDAFFSEDVPAWLRDDQPTPWESPAEPSVRELAQMTATHRSAELERNAAAEAEGGAVEGEAAEGEAADGDATGREDMLTPESGGVPAVGARLEPSDAPRLASGIPAGRAADEVPEPKPLGHDEVSPTQQVRAAEGSAGHAHEAARRRGQAHDTSPISPAGAVGLTPPPVAQTAEVVAVDGMPAEGPEAAFGPLPAGWNGAGSRPESRTSTRFLNDFADDDGPRPPVRSVTGDREAVPDDGAGEHLPVEVDMNAVSQLGHPARQVLAEPAAPPEAAEGASAAQASARGEESSSPSDSSVRRFARHTDTLPRTDSFGHSAGREGHVELPLRRTRNTQQSINIDSVVRDPAGAIARAAKRLEANPRDTVAQDEMLALLGSSDPELVRSAWQVLEPALRDAPDRADAYFGALVVMANSDGDRGRRVEFLRQAASVAVRDLDEPRQAFELLIDALAVAPDDTPSRSAAADLARDHGWWEDFVSLVDARARSAGSPQVAGALSRIAGTAATQELRDERLAEQIYDNLVDRGVYDEDVVAALVNIYAKDGRSADTLVLLLRCAEMAEGEERVHRLTRAADLCAEELNDPARAMDIYEGAMQRDMLPAIRERYIDLARRTGQSSRAVEHLSKLDGSFEAAMERAEMAREVFGDADMEIDALQAAFESDDADPALSGFALADAQRRNGDHDGEVATLESMLAALPPGEGQLAVVRRLAPVYASRNGGAEQAKTLYRESVESGVFDSKVVHALASMLRSDGDVPELVRLLWVAAERSTEAEERRTYLRQLARVAGELIEDEEQSLVLLEEVTDASGGDPEVLLRLAEKCRSAGDSLAEMAALEQAVESDDLSVAPRILTRLAELELARPRGASRAAELLERVLDLEPISEEVLPSLGRILPEVARRAGRLGLELRWYERAARKAPSAEDALLLYRTVIALQERTQSDPEQRVQTVEMAMAAADDAGAEPADVARLHLSASRAKMAVGHWNAAVEHASRCATYFIENRPGAPECIEAVAAIAELSKLVIDERPAFELMRRAAATGVPALRVAYADACFAHERWQTAVEVLEPLVSEVDADTDLRDRLAGNLELARSHII